MRTQYELEKAQAENAELKRKLETAGISNRDAGRLINELNRDLSDAEQQTRQLREALKRLLAAAPLHARSCEASNGFEPGPCSCWLGGVRKEADAALESR